MFKQQHPHTDTDAAAILRNPEQHASSPEVFHFAWAELKAQRGQIYRPENLPGSMHQIIDETSLMERVRNYARDRGYPLTGDRSA